MLEYTGLFPASNYIYVSEPVRSVYIVQSSNVAVFLQRFIDLSSFSFFNFGDVFTTYEAEHPPAQIREPVTSDYFFVAQVVQC